MTDKYKGQVGLNCKTCEVDSMKVYPEISGVAIVTLGKDSFKTLDIDKCEKDVPMMKGVFKKFGFKCMTIFKFYPPHKRSEISDKCYDNFNPNSELLDQLEEISQFIGIFNSAFSNCYHAFKENKQFSSIWVLHDESCKWFFNICVL